MYCSDTTELVLLIVALTTMIAMFILMAIAIRTVDDDEKSKLMIGAYVTGGIFIVSMYMVYFGCEKM